MKIYRTYSVSDVCETCEGSGRDPEDRRRNCPACRATGVTNYRTEKQILFDGDEHIYIELEDGSRFTLNEKNRIFYPVEGGSSEKQCMLVLHGYTHNFVLMPVAGNAVHIILENRSIRL